MSLVLVVDQERRPLAPVHPGQCALAAVPGESSRVAASALYADPETDVSGGAARAAAAQDRSGLQNDGAGGGQRWDRAGGVGSGSDPSWGGGQASPRPAARGAAESAAAAHALSKADGFATADGSLAGSPLPAEPGAERDDLGGAAEAAVPNWGALEWNWSILTRSGCKRRK